MVPLISLIVVFQVVAAVVQSQNEAVSLVECSACQTIQSKFFSCEVSCKTSSLNRVAFSAILDNSYPSLAHGDVVKYDVVELNLGNGYDSSTGVFTVPEGGEGLYHFTTSYRNTPGTFVYLGIHVKGISRCESESDNNQSPGDSGMGSCRVIIYLNKGDQVNVVYKQATDGRSLFFNYGIFNAFNGYRIN